MLKRFDKASYDVGLDQHPHVWALFTDAGHIVDNNINFSFTPSAKLTRTEVTGSFNFACAHFCVVVSLLSILPLSLLKVRESQYGGLPAKYTRENLQRA